MNGLANHALELFTRANYGAEFWEVVCNNAGLGLHHFEPLSSYEAQSTERLVDATAAALSRSQSIVLEDLGAWLVSAGSAGHLRRLLRFSGTSYIDFLHSLEELPARAKLVLPELHLPKLQLQDIDGSEFHLFIEKCFKEASSIFLGLLRAMADDYGALVILDYLEKAETSDVIRICVLDTTYSERTPFELGRVES